MFTGRPPVWRHVKFNGTEEKDGSWKKGVIVRALPIMLILALIAVPAALLADGSLDYKTKCAYCHGANANLLPKTARLLKVDPKKLSLKTSGLNREEMIAVVEKGRGGMPGFANDLSKDQITGIVDYLSGVKKK